MKKPKVDREYPSLSILCEMYEVVNDPKGLAGFYGAVGTAQAEAYSQACADLGDRVHKALESFELAKDGDVIAWPTDARERYMCQLLVDWINQSQMQAVDCAFSENGKAIEVKLDSKLLDYSCRADRIVTFGADKTLWTVDYKTSASMKDSYKMQLAGYSLGWFEKTGKWVDQGVIVRIEKSPKKKQQLEIIPVYELWKWLQPLVYTRQLWSFINGKGIHANDGAIEAA